MPRPNSRLHWRRVWPAAIVLTAFAALTAVSVLRPQVATATAPSFTKKPTLTNALVPGISKAELKAIARGETSPDDHRLSNGLLWARDKRNDTLLPVEICSTLKLRVSLDPPKGSRHDYTMRGLPFPWVTKSNAAKFHNVFSDPDELGTAFADSVFLEAVPPVTLGRDMVLTLRSRHPKEFSHSQAWTIDLAGVATSLVLAIIAAWLFRTLLRWMIRITRHSQRRGGASAAHRLVEPALVTIVALAIMAAMAFWPALSYQWHRIVYLEDRVGFDDQLSRRFWQSYATTLDQSQIRELSRSDGGEAIIARSILTALRPLREATNDEDKVYLCAGWASETIEIDGRGKSFGWPWLICARLDLRQLTLDEAGRAVQISWPQQVRWWLVDKGAILIGSATDGSNTSLRLTGINVKNLGLVTLLLWLLWVAARGVCWLIHWRIVRRRRSRGQCTACGYRMQPVPA